MNSVIDTVFFQDIHIEDEKFVVSKFTERRCRKGQVVFFQGEIGHEMYIVKSGSLKIFREHNAKEIILGHQFQGETIGELEVVHHNNTRLASVAAMEESVLWVINKQNLEELINTYPQLLRKLFYVVSERLDQADRKLDYLAFLDTRLRVVNLLLDLHSNFGLETNEGYLINWKITQQHFAFMIGVNRESAARALQELQTDNIISIDKKLITILDLSTLQKMSSSPYPKEEFRKWHSTYKYDISNFQ
jgi:CRP/FNR family cyclic AMP-dependent transcriptional regulator